MLTYDQPNLASTPWCLIFLRHPDIIWLTVHRCEVWGVNTITTYSHTTVLRPTFAGFSIQTWTLSQCTLSILYRPAKLIRRVQISSGPLFPVACVLPTPYLAGTCFWWKGLCIFCFLANSMANAAKDTISNWKSYLPRVTPKWMQNTTKRPP